MFPAKALAPIGTPGSSGPQAAHEHLLCTQGRYTEGKTFIHSFWAKKHLVCCLSSSSPHHMSPTSLATLLGCCGPTTERLMLGSAGGLLDTSPG